MYSQWEHKLFGSRLCLFPVMPKRRKYAWEYAEFRTTESSKSGKDMLVEVTERYAISGCLS